MPRAARWSLRRVVALVCGVLWLVGPERPAGAYTYGSAVSAGCHERISMAALREVRGERPDMNVQPEPNDRALIGDVPFALDGDMHDLAAATFLIGVRDNDLKGNGPAEVDALAAIHGDPANQNEHCLRARDEDEPDGSPRALEACRRFIRERAVEALDGLDANGIPDPTRRADLDVSLSLRGRVTASLPLYWVRIGQAIHTVQDGFSHTFRSADRLRVRTVLEWLEFVAGTDDESRDGPTHRHGLDACDKLDDLRTLNIEVATRASIDLLQATLGPASRDAKLAAIDAMLAKYFTFEPGCSAANAWCDAPEQKYEIAAGCGCSVVGARSGEALTIAACGLGVLILVARRRRRRLARLAVLPVVLACLASASTARAQVAPPEPATTTTDPATGAPVPTEEKAPAAGVPTASEAKAEQTETAHRRFFGLYAAGSGSVTNPGLSGQLGLRFRLSERWSVGVDGEINGWYAVHTGGFRTGALNLYATAILHYPIRFSQVNLRSTLNLGTSTMLIDLYGAPRGTTGLFFGLVPLGLELKLGSAVYLVFDALGVALPVPQLQGAPFAYPQYRTALGLELTF